MKTIDQTVKVIEEALSSIKSIQAERDRLEENIPLSEDEYMETNRRLGARIYRERLKMKQVLRDFEIWPEYHFSKLKRELERFHIDFPYEESVFVMTKYPDSNTKVDQELQTVIDTVTHEVRIRGFEPRLALSEEHHCWLWGNVQVYMLGCCKGIAIVEDRYHPELNPNVAMEWGWMSALQRPVLFLREQNFEHDRADWSGLINHPFDWDSPPEGVQTALDKFLGET